MKTSSRYSNPNSRSTRGLHQISGSNGDSSAAASIFRGSAALGSSIRRLPPSSTRASSNWPDSTNSRKRATLRASASGSNPQDLWPFPHRALSRPGAAAPAGPPRDPLAASDARLGSSAPPGHTSAEIRSPSSGRQRSSQEMRFQHAALNGSDPGPGDSCTSAIGRRQVIGGQGSALPHLFEHPRGIVPALLQEPLRIPRAARDRFHGDIAAAATSPRGRSKISCAQCSANSPVE